MNTQSQVEVRPYSPCHLLGLRPHNPYFHCELESGCIYNGLVNMLFCEFGEIDRVVLSPTLHINIPIARYTFCKKNLFELRRPWNWHFHNNLKIDCRCTRNLHLSLGRSSHLKKMKNVLPVQMKLLLLQTLIFPYFTYSPVKFDQKGVVPGINFRKPGNHPKTFRWCWKHVISVCTIKGA